MMISGIDTRVDVTDKVDLNEPVETAVSVFLPPSKTLPPSPTVVFAFPGGTYSRAYYDLHVPGRDGYSFGEHLAKSGHVVIACDHVGLGDSTPYEPFSELTKDIVITADQATVRGVMDRLAAGTLVDGFGPMRNPFTIGVGHSMGARLLTLQQVRYNSFDAMAVLSSSRLPTRRTTKIVRRIAQSLGNWRGSDPMRPPRERLHGFFHDESVPDDVKAADDALAVPLYPWMSQVGRGGILEDPAISEAAHEIDVPIFLCFGDRDVSRDPHSEVLAYPKSKDISLLILPRSAHCTNFAETRALFFDRIAGWVREMSRTRRPTVHGNMGSTDLA